MKVLFIMLLSAAIAGCASTGSESRGGKSNPEPQPVAEASAAAGAEAASVADANDTSDDDKVICYREQKSGSHFTRKVCKTKREIKEDRRLAKELLDRSTAHDDSQINQGQ